MIDERAREALYSILALEDERAEVNHRNDLLTARIAELEDEADRKLREEYRRGYRAGYFTGRQGRSEADAPEDARRMKGRR